MHLQVEDQPSKKTEKEWLHKCRPILRKSTKVLRSCRRVQFSRSHAASRKHSRKQRSIAWSDSIKNPHQRSPHAPKLEDRSQEETERQERCARGDAWIMAKSVLKLKENDKATFFLPTEVWCLHNSSKNGRRIKRQHGELRTDRCPWSIDRLSYNFISDIFTAGSRNSYTASRINKK